MGYTKPEVTDATHNVGLSPLFFERTGEVMINHDKYKRVLVARGQEGMLQAPNDQGHFFVMFGSGYIDPSRTLNGVRVFSLRCLVSTNNG